MTQSNDPAEVYRQLGVTPVITASGSTTVYGGSKLLPEVKEAMNQASGVMVELADLQRAAGEVIANLTGAEAGLVSSGAAGGLVLQAAAVIAGSDPIKMDQLPNTDGLRDEIIMQRSHRFAYDQCYRAAGATIVDIGDGRRCAPWQLEAAFTEKTAAVAYLFSPFVSRRGLPFDQVCEIAHTRDVPVIVDAASFIPPRANLKRFIAEGADMVIYSGGKAVRGPQGAGILCGRADLIEAAAANGAPFQFVGRGMKVAKEEIVGLVKALQIFVDVDEEAEMEQYAEMCRSVVDAFVEMPGLRLTVEHDEYDYLLPHAIMKFTDDWRGPSRDDVLEAMTKGDPPIYLHTLGQPDELGVDPFNLSEQELETVIRRLREEIVR